MPDNLRRFMISFWEKGKYTLCLFLPPIFLLSPVVAQYPFPQHGSQYSDMVISHFPNAYYLIESLVRWRVIPLWSSTILSGYPFVANPLSGMWYLPNWIALIFPLPVGINLLIIVHLIWGGIGVFRLLKNEGVSNVAALFGGLAFELMPKLFAHFGAGHVSMIFAVCWTPWLIICAQDTRASKPGKTNKKYQFLSHIVFPALVLSSIIFADIRWIGYSTLLWIAYLGTEWLSRKTINSKLENNQAINEKRNIWSLFQRIIFPIVLAIGLTAPFLLPFFEYVQLSTRSILSSKDILVFSLPPTKLLGLFFPPFGDYYEWIIYPGVVLFILAGISWVTKNHSKYKTYWTIIFIVTLFFAFGSYLPGAALFTRIPGINLMRVPSRIIFISGMSIACVAARGLDEILYKKSGMNLQAVKLLLAAFVAFLILLNIGAAWLTAQWVKNFIWSLIFGCLGSFTIWVIIQRKAPIIWGIVIFGVCIIDWMVVDRSLFSTRSAQQVLEENQSVVDYLLQDNDIFRVYSPSYSLPQQAAVINGIELADGIDPLQLAGYVDFMEEASGVTIDGYSVTLPPFENGNPTRDNQSAKPNPELLGLLNVKYVVAEYDINVDGLEFVAKFDQSYLYKNQYWLPRVWLQSLDEPIGTNISSVADIYWSPNRIQISLEPCDENQRLFLSELYYPGWQVYINGQKKQIEVLWELFRTVEIQPGDKIIEFRFSPYSLYWGLLICFTTLLLMTGTLFLYEHQSQPYTS